MSALAWLALVVWGIPAAALALLLLAERALSPVEVPMREHYWPDEFDYRPEGEAWDRHVNDMLAVVEPVDLDEEWQRFGGAR